MTASTSLHQSATLQLSDGTTISLIGTDKRCPVCGSHDKNGLWAKIDQFEIRACAACQTLHLTPLPNAQALSLLYNTHYYKDVGLSHGYLDYRAEQMSIERTYQARLEKIHRVVEHFYPNGFAHVHEIGSALGFGLPIAESIFKTRITASDISEEAIKACLRLGYETFKSDEFGRATAAQLNIADLVYSFDVIEHLTNIPMFVKWLASFIRLGGFFCVTTPDMQHPLNRVLHSRSPSIKVPQHVIYFTDHTLSKALSNHFRLIRSFWDFQILSLGSLATRLLHILGLPPRGRNIGPAVPIYNGMKLYLFERI
ncbi:MAG: class I SAM-dependent methyltransferase [Syntrophales bacterium]